MADENCKLAMRELFNSPALHLDRLRFAWGVQAVVAHLPYIPKVRSLSLFTTSLSENLHLVNPHLTVLHLHSSGDPMDPRPFRDMLACVASSLIYLSLEDSSVALSTEERKFDCVNMPTLHSLMLGNYSDVLLVEYFLSSFSTPNLRMLGLLQMSWEVLSKTIEVLHKLSPPDGFVYPALETLVIEAVDPVDPERTMLLLECLPSIRELDIGGGAADVFLDYLVDRDLDEGNPAGVLCPRLLTLRWCEWSAYDGALVRRFLERRAAMGKPLAKLSSDRETFLELEEDTQAWLRGHVEVYFRESSFREEAQSF
ncbi:hypothetical protein GLOTRDRAFT_128986 [Gloeophyllum trabeum ATCC 11539]|uniref:F-box domain-containing protein n=1 Tax=Gloeophyllum trabeum (strain ATCC 11539 / FP-39264 / Madison 617) TaxID=670483 RepID=S7RRX9_GLOTA|nr:uncharacterized protein GLOTRDRAFT_128986 [Gloeophyllum trabeum ATCC 11539]EPQ55769.1 hypothetical protein GLOTRDRAFT_128986 [Gloeophyllum trabeum ATCC 11539]